MAEFTGEGEHVPRQPLAALSAHSSKLVKL